MNYQRPILRDYQIDAVDSVEKQLETHRSTMIVMATGLGKTQIFCELARRTAGKVLILAHRAELVDQAKHRIDELTNEWAAVDRAGEVANTDARIVVGSIQTVQRDSRMKRYPPDHFSLIIADENHHYVSKTFKRPLEYFSKAKILGVTATPDRLDKRGLGEIFQSVAYRMDILDGITKGWLVPIRGHVIRVEEVDLSDVGKVGSDLNQGELDLTILKACEGIIQKTMEMAEDKQTIIFFPGVASAEFAANRINHLKPGSAAFVGAKTESYLRGNIVHQFKTGKIQYLCNCQVATEGFDAPSVSVIACARPTLSRALYTQMVGRGVRPWGMPEGLCEAERKGYIMSSSKPECHILDFVGNSGKYSLMSPADVLGNGRYTDVEIQYAKKIVDEEEQPKEDQAELLERAREELKKLAEVDRLKVRARIEQFDPFAVLHLDGNFNHVEFGFEPMTPGQKGALSNFGVPRSATLGYSKRRAKKVLDALFQRKRLKLATFRQLQTLEKFGLRNPNISFFRASKALDVIAAAGGNRQLVDREKLADVLGNKGGLNDY